MVRISANRVLAVACALALFLVAGCASATGSGAANGSGTTPTSGAPSEISEIGGGNPSEAGLPSESGAPKSETATGGEPPAWPPDRCDLRNSVFGVCFDTPPSIACCSLAAVTWSQIVVGERFTVAGRARTGADAYTALGVRSPSGHVTPLPLDQDGRFHQEVSFDEQGQYWIVGQGSAGTVGGGESEPGWKEIAPFWVPYRAEVVEGTPWREVFGEAWNPGLQTLAVPAGQVATVRLRLTDAAGRPAANEKIVWWPNHSPLETDADGVATIRYDDRTADYPGAAYSMGVLYVGVHAISYRVLRVEDGQLTGFPSGATLKAAAFGDEELFSIPAFLDAVRSRTVLDQPQLPDCPDANVSLPHWNGDARLLELGCPGDNGESEYVISPDTGEMWHGHAHDVVARFRAAEKDGVVYADLHGLAAALNGFMGGHVGAHAAATPDGGLAVSIFQVP